MVEVMEPTDLMVIPERNLFGIELPDEKRYGGLTPEDALKVFDYTVYPREALIEKCCPTPELMAESPGGKLERIISRQKEKFFEAQRLTLNGEWKMNFSEKSFRIGIVVEGSLTLTAGGHCIRAKAGESFCAPYDTADCCMSGNASVLLVIPPA